MRELESIDTVKGHARNKKAVIRNIAPVHPWYVIVEDVFTWRGVTREGLDRGRVESTTSS